MRDGRASERTAFLQELDAGLVRDADHVAVARIDLDRFARIGQTFGPAVARTVASVLESRMLSVAGDASRLLAYSQESFVCMVPIPDSTPEALETTGMDIVELVSSPIDIAGERIAVGSNVGIVAAADFPEPDALRVLAAAEFAVQRADTLGSRRVIVYHVAPQDDPTRLPHLFADMLPAIGAGQFVAHYQPVRYLPDLTLAGAEALVRWNHPRHGLIPPLEFLPEAEASGLIRQIDANVRQTACAACSEWPGSLNVGVNVSAADLDSPALVESVATAIMTTGLDPYRLILEVTETALSQDWSRSLRRLQALKELGVRLAVDDFGAGHMFLDRLGIGLFDILKLDRSLIAVEPDPDGRHDALLSSVTAMAHALGLEVVAEGVETQAHLDRAIAAGCGLAQGYFLARPMSHAGFLAALLELDPQQ